MILAGWEADPTDANRGTTGGATWRRTRDRGVAGIGAAIARTLAAGGRPVGVNYVERSAAADAVVQGSWPRAAGRWRSRPTCPIRRPRIRCSRGAEEELGAPVLVLVNNAGVRADNLSPAMEDEEWQRVLDTNLSAAFRTTRRALRAMMRARYGRVINVASVVGQRASPGQANYAAAKAGLVAFTKTVAAEVARRGVTVNAVAPGFVETEMTTGVDPACLSWYRPADWVPRRRWPHVCASSRPMTRAM